MRFDVSDYGKHAGALHASTNAVDHIAVLYNALFFNLPINGPTVA